ncbi:LEA type 2 family protein [Xanthomonas arboricola]|uniref:NDR1/HIN1-like protein n=1 Tax=Xanthomonas arboricola TaxID=56448 RepID=UPI000464D26F|nr:LEA type 2 family protein [Xanthomonas arboricola]
MRRAYRLLIVSLACGLLLSACGGAVRRVSEPAASIQQLTVRADGSWSVDLRLQNYSSIPMQFERVALEISAGDQLAGKLDQSVGISIGPETADVVSVSVQPTSLGRLTVADVLAGGRSLPYSLKGTVWATPQEKKQRDFSVESRNTLSPAPGLNGVLR